MKKTAFIIPLLLAAVTTFAQPGGPQGTGINASLLKMFGDIKAFSAKGTISMLDAQEKETQSMPVTMALLDGKLRTELDMSEMKGGMMSPDAAAMIKSTGMDKMHMLITPEQKSTVIIYPGLQSYASVPISEDELGEARVETTELGKETVDGHPCVKRKLASTDSKGKTHEAFVWSATDLNGFPVKMQMKEKKQNVLITFKAPSLEKPDAKLFEMPAGYTKYDSVPAMMQGAMMKMLGR